MEIMTIEAKVLAKNILREGESNGNAWRVQPYIVETTDQFPTKLEIEFWNEKIEECVLHSNEVVKISFSIKSREYNNRLYYSFRGISVERAAAAATTAAAAQVPQMPPKPMPAPAPQPTQGNTELPF